MKRKILLRGISILIVLMMTLCIFSNSYAANQSKIDNLKQQKEDTQKELNEVDAKKSEAEDELDNINSKIQNVRSEIDKLNDEIEKLNVAISDKEKEIQDEEEEIKRKDELLKQRMVALYEAGDTSFLDVLFDSENIFDFLSSYSIIQQILETDTALIDELEKEKQQLEVDKVGLEDDKQKVEDSKAEQENKSAQLKVLKSEQQEVINNLSDEKKALANKIKEFENDIEAAQAEIKKEENKNGHYEGKFEGVLEWPVSYNYNIITSIFGNRTAPTAGASTNHGAIDIGVSYVPVYAPADGKVTVASYVSGYGNYIKIDHGNGYYTAFGHLSAYKVSAGQTVSKGQQIAVSGNTGVSTGPHLHYEVYIGGSSKGYRVDPLKYTSHPSLIYH